MSLVITAHKQTYFNQVWDFVRTVPFGKVVTYGQIAQVIPEPLDLSAEMNSVSQLVGNAMAACPSDVPWHRVINAQGRVSSRANATYQQQLLEEEGLIFYQGRVSLEQYQWFDEKMADRPEQRSLF